MSRSAQAVVATKTAYEGSVIVRAMERGGANPHLKGLIHEVMVKDMRNVRNLFNGRSTQLTRSTTAKVVDLVTKQGGKVVERIQVKDVVSPSGVNKLVRQVAQGKYRSAQLVGSQESAERVNAALKKAGLSKRMASTGISSDTTTSLAQRAGATGSGTLGLAVRQAARSGGIAGAAVGAGVELVSGLRDLYRGQRSGGEVACAVVKAGAKGGVSGAAAGAAATVTGAAVASGLATVGAGPGLALFVGVAAPIVAAVAVGCAATRAFDSVCSWFARPARPSASHATLPIVPTARR